MSGTKVYNLPTELFLNRQVHSGQGSSDATKLLPMDQDAGTQATSTLFDGRYEPLRCLGRGGMGEVWLARDRGLGLAGRKVAIKRLLPGYVDDEEMGRRFRREEHVLARVRSSRFPVIHTTGVADGVPYYVMELVEGRTLFELMGEPAGDREPLRTFRPMDAASIAMQILEGLDGMHAVGHVHRDIKPGNIMIDRRDGVKIVDFGIARSVDPSDGLTRVGVGIGTQPYCSPEQLAGGTVTPKSDVYSTGVLLTELLTGRRARWNVPSPLKRQQRLGREMRALDDDGAPRWLVQTCLDMLAESPEDRPRADVVQRRLARHVRAYAMELEEPADTYTVPKGCDVAEDIARARTDRRAPHEGDGRDAAIDALRQRCRASGDAGDGRWQDLSLLFGDLYYFGSAVPRDWSRAMAWYAASDAPMAQVRMAFILSQGGNGVEQDPLRARRHVDAAYAWVHGPDARPDVDDADGLRRSIDELRIYLHSRSRGRD